VTTRHLLIHTAGWVGDHFADFGPGDDALARMTDSLAALPQLTPLGEVWSYCNSGFCLAGRIVEVVAGRPYEVAIQELVLDPLGLAHTLFSADDVMTRRFATGHLPDGDGEDGGAPRVARPWGLPRAQAPAGALSSTVGDLLRYARFHASAGEGVLRDASLRAMRSPNARRGAADEEMGLGWFLAERDGRWLVSHTGATNGQAALLMFLPDEDTALAVLTNHQRGAGVCRATLDALGLGEPQRTAIDLDPSEYLGVYTSALADAEVRRDDASLVLAFTYKAGFPTPDSPPLPSPPPAPVAFFDRDRLFVCGGPMGGTEGDFLRGADGSLRWLRFGGRIAARQRAS
jgi:CubicO group peptidase (beta-lactamase class C family)